MRTRFLSAVGFILLVAGVLFPARSSPGQCSSFAYARQVSGDVAVMESLGSLLFVGMPGLVEIHDLAAPDTPVRIAAIPVRYEPSAIAVNGNLLYISTWSFGDSIGSLVVVDIAAPASPVVLADITWNDEVEDSAAGTDRLCLLNNADEILILDVTSPGQPITGSTLSGQAFRSIEVRQNVLYATFNDTSTTPSRSKLRTWGIGNITSANIITTIDLGEAQGFPTLDRLGTTLATVAADRLSIFSLSTPGTPALLGTASGARIGAKPHLTEHNGITLCHMLARGFSAGVWDVSNPAIPTFLANYGVQPGPLTAVGQHAYLLESTDLFAAYSFINPSSPTRVWVNDYGLPGRCFDLHASGTVIVLPESVGVLPERFTLIDVADPDQPQLAGIVSLDAAESLQGSDVSGTMLGFLALEGGPRYKLHLYDIANPASPTLLSDGLEIERTSPFSNNELYLDGRTGVIEFANEYIVLDLADPSAPRIASRIAAPGSGWGYFEDGVLAVLDTSGVPFISVFDVTNPDRPTLAATIAEPNAEDLSLSGRMLAVLRANDTTAIHDLSVPAAPILRSTIPRPGSMARVTTAMLVDSLCVLSEEGRTALYSLTSPGSPVLLGESGNSGSAYAAHRVNNDLWTLGLGSTLNGFTIPDLPVVTSQPRDRAPCPGATVVLSADATSASTATYRWRYNGSLLDNGAMANGTVVSGAFSRTLTLTNFNPLDAGVFSLRFTNTCGSVLSDNAVVIAGGNPRFINVPSQRETCAFGSVTMSVRTEFPADTSIRWQAELPFGSGNFFNISDFSSSEHTVTGATTPTLTIAAQPDGRIPDFRATRYRAVATNACGSTTSTDARLTICGADVNCDLFLDFFDYDEFVTAFETGSPASVADFNADGFIDFFDYDEFVTAFEVGC
ncbi:MAG: hypothetical protein HEQ23_14295 [Tepidisphaera sp.]